MVDADKSETSSYKTAPIQISAHVSISGKENPRCPPSRATVDSETASFRQREAELASIAKRFAGSGGRRYVSSSVVSRFREEFDHSLSESPRKHSLLSRLLQKKAKSRNTLQKQNPFPDGGHRNCVADALAAAGPNTVVWKPSGQGFTSGEGDLKLEESATDLWQRAVRLEADRRDARYRHQGQLIHSRKASELKDHQSRDASKEGKNTGIAAGFTHCREGSSVYSRAHSVDRSGVRSPRSTPVTGHGNTQVTSTSLETSSRILKEWQHQMQFEASDLGRPPSLTIRPFSSQRSRVIPDSWAKWPSHDRSGRNGATGTSDSVIPKDFALSDTSANGNNGNIKWSTDKAGNRYEILEVHVAPKQQSFSAKLGRTLRDSLAKFIPSRDSSIVGLGSSSGEGKNRPGSTGYLEYPELELLPQHGGHEELEALEKTIDHIKSSSVSLEIRPRGLSGASSKTPLSLRFVQEVQNLQHEDREGSPDTAGFLGATAPLHFDTSAGPRTISKAFSANSQRFGTPMTHLSYDDCVPKHMLEDNNSAKSDTTIMIKRSQSAIEHNVASLPRKYDTWSGRAKSVSVKRQKACGSELGNLIAAEKEKRRQSKDVLTLNIH